jgi:abscisate beta-glucosyltransferase
MSANSYTDTSMLQEPLQNLLLERKPDCIVHDVFHRWSADAIDSAGIPRITFNGNGCFAHCVRENMERYEPHEKVTSDLEPFIVPGLPDGIELTTSQLPFLGRPPNGGGLHKRMRGSDEKSFGVMVNSFYELETAYVDYFRNELGNRAWLVGPVSLCNRNVEDKAERGQKTSVNEQTILSWLDSEELDSVLYVSFGS